MSSKIETMRQIKFKNIFVSFMRFFISTVLMFANSSKKFLYKWKFEEFVYDTKNQYFMIRSQLY